MTHDRNAKPMFDFITTAERSALGILIAIYFISESVISKRMRAGREDRTDDRGSSRLLVIVFPLAWWIGIALVLVPQGSFGNTTVFRAGLLVIFAGQLLRWWAVATLGRLFTVNVAIRAGHRLIESGPYRYVRHPSYSAVLLVHLGAALCFGNALTAFVLMVPTTVALLNRIRVEEDVLASGLGQTYRDYMTRTKRLIPGLY